MKNTAKQAFSRITLRQPSLNMGIYFPELLLKLKNEQFSFLNMNNQMSPYRI
jgi:hypothetical protein